MSSHLFACACGCALQLSARDQAQAAWILALAGTERHQVGDAKPLEQRQGRSESPEPTAPVVCRYCGKTYQLALFLVAALEGRRAPEPACEACEHSIRSQP